ncbi:retrovirus polyprotein, putative [Perkinsus marinus ATCC 50983]|uniref:Retrovirus polyprotein, putative n=1 Tax=Perkinsus marinus (strain ATCC 50983 / TXsc) TaxID=423536 RepID=C5KM78_PERM5|nr:retrovirus polyprotein, putative [Perkinsus marinus ATCC 50983]EER14439.1 retrovirus polyprotein, putative [Perkinsus marinus ATCC 50983]|eukprot:XP_002782644.1 retrovirus polyprotein, putative [Perkinsus marinus ATCC 50983]
MVNGNSPTSQHGSTAENGTPWDWVTNLEKQVMDDNNVGPSRPSTTVLANLTPLATVEAILGIGGYNRWLDAMSVFRTSNGKELGTDVNGFLMDHALSVMKDSEAESRLSCSRTQLSDYEFKEGLMHSVRATGLGLVGQLLLLSTVLSPALAQTVKDTMIDLAEADEAAYLWLEKEENIQVDRSNCVRWLSFVKKACDAVQLEWTRVVHEDITVSDALQHYSGLRWTKLCTLDQLILKEREAFHYLSRAGDEGVKLGDQARLDVLNRCLPESNRWGYVLTPELNKILRSARSVPEWVSVAKQIRSDSRRSGLLPDREYQPTKSESSTYASYKVETQSRRRGKKAAKDEDKVQEAVKRRLNKARGNKKNKQHVRNSRPLRGSRGAVSGSEDDTEATIVCYHCHGIGHRRPQCPHRETDKAEARRLVKSDTKVPTSSDKSGGTKGPTIRTLRSRRAAAARAPVDYKKVPEHRVHATQTIDNGNGVGSGELDGSSNEHGSDHDPHDEPTGGELAESLANMGALNDLLKGSGRLKWTPESDAAYDRLRRRFEQRYLPFYSVEETSPGPSRRYVVQADASDVAIGFCLWSIDVSKEVSADSLAQSGSLLMWGSKVLNSASRSWPSWDREGYAVYVALCRFRPWLISSMTTAYVLTDNTGCLYKWATMEKSERLLPSLQRGQRWLRWFNMTSDLLVFKSICFKHVKGVENGLADALSRLTNHLLNRDEEAVQTDRCLQTAVGSGEPGNGFLGDCEWAPPPLVGPIQEACREAQPQDGTTKFLGKTISEIYQLVANKGDPNTTTPDWLDRFILFDHCLMMNSLEPVTHLPRWLVVVPAGTIRVDIEGETKSVLIREYLCWLVHSRVATGHPSPAMMKCLLRQHCWWPSMEVCCRTWTSKCHTCQVESARTNRNLGKFSLRRYPGRFEAISVDYTGPYEVSSVGQYRFSLTIMDLCTGYVRFAATRTRCGGEFVATLLKSWGMDFDLPRTILHDRDGAFTAEVVRAWKARSQHTSELFEFRGSISNRFGPRSYIIDWLNVDTGNRESISNRFSRFKGAGSIQGTGIFMYFLFEKLRTMKPLKPKPVTYSL